MLKTARRALQVAAGTLALSLALTACTSPDGAGAPSAPTGQVNPKHNAADTEFAQMMIIHHQGAIEMSDLAANRAATPEVKALAERITTAQGPEIELMTGWLAAWGQETAPADHGGMDHGGMEMDGLDQAGAMADLEARTGTDFDRRFLELMTAHHQGAITMSETVIDQGQNDDVQVLARQIIEAQTQEITEMGELLNGLGS